MDIATWNTLPPRQISSGLAETIKHGCLGDEELFVFLEHHMDEILRVEPAACAYIAEANCRVKYQVVMKDEKETGLREILNLGHTVGRAIETVSDYRLLHGEAVSIGMVAAAKLSCKLGYMTETEAARVKNLLAEAKLPTAIPDYIDREELVRKLYTDKKVRDGRLRFVLQQGIGHVVRFGENSYAAPIAEDAAREIIMEM